MAKTGPSVGWICTSSTLFATAGAVLDEKYEVPSAELGGTGLYCLGRLGSVTVIISCLDKELAAMNVSQMIHDMRRRFNTVEDVLITGLRDQVSGDGIDPGDLLIKVSITPNGHDVGSRSTLASTVAQRALRILHNEVGSDGYFLSKNYSSLTGKVSHVFPSTQFSDDSVNHPKLHYAHAAPASNNLDGKKLVGQLTAMKDFESLDSDLMNSSLPAIVILGTSNQPSSNSITWMEQATVNATLYARELIHIMSNNLAATLDEIAGTEKIVPPFHLEPTLPPLNRHRFPSYGNAVLLVIPTENEFKRKLFEDVFRAQAPADVPVHSITVPVDSGVGEQPYNNAGIAGTHNRINNALQLLDTAERQTVLQEKDIGIVIVASVESYIQTDNIDRPTDYGVVVTHNATTYQTAVRLSCGVTVPPEYVDRARYFGYEGDPDHGRVTVGQVLSANVPGLDKKNWQLVLAGRSRYELLKDAAKQLPIIW